MSKSSIRRRLEELERAGGFKPDWAVIECWDPDSDKAVYIHVDRNSGRSFESDSCELSDEEVKAHE